MPKQHLTYDGVDEANNRLAGTVVTYEGRPVLVDRVEPHDDGILRVLIKEFPYDGRATRKTINSPAFRRFQTPPLGYANYFERGSTHALWCERLSNRTRRQGLSDEIFNATSRIGFRASLGHMRASEAFREMVVGEYPTFADAIERLVPNSSIAVSRDFAVDSDENGFVRLFWRREPLALVVRDRILLRADRTHMRETLAECPNLPANVEVI